MRGLIKLTLMFQSFLKDNRKNGKDGVRTYRSADAQKFLDRVKPRKQIKKQVRRVEKWVEDIDADFEYALANELNKP